MIMHGFDSVAQTPSFLDVGEELLISESLLEDALLVSSDETNVFEAVARSSDGFRNIVAADQISAPLWRGHDCLVNQNGEAWFNEYILP